MSAANPGIARRWVFPIIRIVIFMVVAAALVKLAFFGGFGQPASDSAVPTGMVTDPVLPVQTASIANDVVLDATVQADPAVAVRATAAGTVLKLLAAPGQAVAANTPVLSIKSETAKPDGTPVVKTITLTAGSAGTLSALPILVGQSVAIGDVVGQVAPTSFSVVASLPAAQQYRLLNKPTEGSTAITGGPAPFTCTGLSITTPLAGAGVAASSPGESAATSADAAQAPAPEISATVKCAVPAGVTVFAGLAAKLTIDGGKADGVLVVPTTAVEGTVGAGSVYLPGGKGGKPKKHEVALGLTDGTNVQITSGLKEGEMVMQFVPGAPADPYAMGGVVAPGMGG